jgi:hypothetical protein
VTAPTSANVPVRTKLNASPQVFDGTTGAMIRLDFIYVGTASTCAANIGLLGVRWVANP